ncbi:MAG: helix-turn-helix transcriptional regulator [Algibacter sp.]
MEYIKNSEFLIQFGNNLKRTRKSKGFTQAELANDLGIEISQISRIERGIINTSVSTIYEISQALKVDITDLFNFDKKIGDF